MESKVLYSDKLVEITDETLLLRNYYFPFGSKRVALSRVGSIAAMQPTLRNGKWRIWGTFNFRTWFPRDWKRPSRDRIFVISFPNRGPRIGFTVEDSETVTRILGERGLLEQNGPA